VVRCAGVGMVVLLFTSATASYLVRAVVAVAAAVALLVAAQVHRDGLATPRRLFAAALLVGAVSGVASAGYSVVTGHPSPTGWLADWIYLSYAPLAVAACLELVVCTAGLPIDAALAQEAVYYGLLSSSPEMREGTAAFLARRAPEFRGKNHS
jgi:hypothetical protein